VIFYGMFASGEKQQWAEPSSSGDAGSPWSTDETFKSA
jgi:hypothetical protein